jgi:aryl-alcohol dehydrogenase-like predicted oxidoreductase
METRRLGRSDVQVTRVVLGGGSFGGVGSAPALFGRGTSQEEAFRIMDAAYDLGITTFDTADAYGGGRSESMIGEWLRTKPNDVRAAITIQTKTYNPMDAGEDRGLARPRILRQFESSLRRLGVDHVAVYMAHEFDPEVPQEETLLAFDELVRSGKVGSVGASNFSAEHLAESIELSELEGVTRYEVVQNEYHLLDRRDSETVFAVCREHEVAYQAFGPLAGGWLTGKYRRGEDPPAGSRMTLRPGPYEHYRDDRTYSAVESLCTTAAEQRTSPAALALAWLLAQDEVTTVVAGPARAEHLEDVAEALRLRLGAEELDALTEAFA